MKRFFACLLSLMLFICPLSVHADVRLTTEDVISYLFEGIDDVISGSKSGLSVSLSTSDGTSGSAGFGQTSSGFSVNYTTPAGSLLTDGSNAYFTTSSGTSSVALDALLNNLMASVSGGQPLPFLTEDDLQLLSSVGTDLLTGLLASDSFAVSLHGNLTTLHIDLDDLAHALDELIPKALSSDQEKTNALLAKFTPLLFGQAVTLEQLISMWHELGLKNVQTGLTLDAVLALTGNGLNIIASCMDWSIKIDVNETSFAFAVTTPDGIVYPFDTIDLLTVSGILASVPSYITEEAVTVEQTISDSSYRGARGKNAVTTTHVTTDLALVIRDLITGLRTTLINNSLSVDMLLKKYQPWINLFSTPRYNSNGAQLPPVVYTVDRLVSQLSQLPMPDSCMGEVTVVVDQVYGTTTVDGYLGEIFFEADFSSTSDQTMIAAAIRIPSYRSTFELTLNGSIDIYRGNVFTLACSEDLGGFRSVTFSIIEPSYRERTVTLTTDTDVFHCIMSSDRTGERIDAKLGEFMLEYTQASKYLAQMQPQTSLRASWPGGFANLIVTDSSVQLDSNLFGFSYMETRNAIRLEGYISESDIYMTPSSFSLMIDGDNEVAALSVLPYDGGTTHCTYLTGRLSILSDGQLTVLEDTKTGTSTQNIAALTVDGQIVMTVVSDVLNGEDVIIRLYNGADMTGEWLQLTFDFGAAGMEIPADAVEVSPEEFLNLLSPQSADPEPQPAEANDADSNTLPSVN